MIADKRKLELLNFILKSPDHVNKFMMSKFLARLESEYRKLAFHTANVDLQVFFVSF